MDPAVVEKTNTPTAMRTRQPLKADATNALPTRLQIVASGKWDKSIKGDLEITISDLEEMVKNFKKGIGLPNKGSAGAPIDYKHEDWSRAAGWIKKLVVENGILYADQIEWTPRAQQEIIDKEWQFFSPSFYPACLGSYYDFEDPTIVATNVLVGGGLTNIPFFKGLTGLKASTTASAEDNESEIFINDSNRGESMDLSVVRNKATADVTAEEKVFLKEHQSELTAAEIAGFGLETTAAPVDTPAQKTDIEKAMETAIGEATPEQVSEALALQASIKEGKKTLVNADSRIDAARFDAMSKELEDMKKEKVAAKIEAHVARGAIKQDQAEEWGKRVMADSSLEKLLDAIDDNKVLASENGSGEDGTVSAVSQLRAKAADIVKASREAGNEISANDAMSQARRENADLRAAADEEIKSL